MRLQDYTQTNTAVEAEKGAAHHQHCQKPALVCDYLDSKIELGALDKSFNFAALHFSALLLELSSG